MKTIMRVRMVSGFRAVVEKDNKSVSVRFLPHCTVLRGSTGTAILNPLPDATKKTMSDYCFEVAKNFETYERLCA